MMEEVAMEVAVMEVEAEGEGEVVGWGRRRVAYCGHSVASAREKPACSGLVSAFRLSSSLRTTEGGDGRRG